MPGASNKRSLTKKISGRAQNDQAIGIGEEVKIGIHLAIERFLLDESRKELQFPSSLTASERLYVHRLILSMPLKSKSRGKKANRVLTLAKKCDDILGDWSAEFCLTPNSRYQINSLLQRFPLTDNELSNLQPGLQRNSTVSREFSKLTTGRLNNGLPQVPPKRRDSSLSIFSEMLPIMEMREEILASINNHQVSLVAGETGSGKTTQVPQMILDDCCARNTACRILCTQPRRIATLSIAERVAGERGEKVGQTVGYQIRLESKVSPKTLLTFCTSGVLLRTLMGGCNHLHTVTHIILDEVHERDRFNDFLMVCLKEALPRFKHLKLVLMSATLNLSLFSDYFGGCPVILVPGMLFPVKEYYLEDVLKCTKYSNELMEKLRKSEDFTERREQNVQLNEWFNRQNSSDNITTVGRSERCHGVACLVGNDENETEVNNGVRMDDLLTSAWLSGQTDTFDQILHEIMSENVSADYRHSLTSVTALMVAAGRGLSNIVETLLSLGASLNLVASNGWTALDWARRFDQAEVIELIEAHMASSQLLNTSPTGSMQMMSDEDREMLFVYQQTFDDERVDVSLIVKLLTQVHTSQPMGAVLVFLPGYDTVVAVANGISKCSQLSGCRVSVLHSAMPSSDQKSVFIKYKNCRKVVLATNIAETSITIPDIVYVIDSGKVKEKAFCILTHVSSLKSNWISKASAHQRKGRAGRCQFGICYRLFSRARYASMIEYQLPEILRLQIHDLCLHCKLLAPKSVSIAEFLSRCPQPPSPSKIDLAIVTLKQIDALDDWEDLTEIGHHLVDLPVEPRLGKMVLYAVILKCLDPILTIVCTLANKEPFMLPSNSSERVEAIAARRKFAGNTFSDHMIFLRAFQMWQKARVEGWEASFCESNYISSAGMEMVVGIRAQLLGQLRASGFVRARGSGDIRDLNTNSENWAVVKAALCAGLFPNLLYVDRKKNTLRTIRRHKLQIRFHQQSVLNMLQNSNNVASSKKLHATRVSQLPSNWLLFDEMTSMEHLALIRCCTVISPITAILFAGQSRLPADAMKTEVQGDDSDEEFVGSEQSDSDGEEKVDCKKCQLTLDKLLSFSVTPEDGMTVFQLRQKWNSLFLQRMRVPSKPLSHVDEAVICAIVNVLTCEEQSAGLHQPAGIGQRPRPMSAETILCGGPNLIYSSNYTDCSDTLEHCQPLQVPQVRNCLLASKSSSDKCSSPPSYHTKTSSSASSSTDMFLSTKPSQSSTQNDCVAYDGDNVACVRSHISFTAINNFISQSNDVCKVDDDYDGQELDESVGEALLKVWDGLFTCQPGGASDSRPFGTADADSDRSTLEDVLRAHHQDFSTCGSLQLSCRQAEPNVDCNRPSAMASANIDGSCVDANRMMGVEHASCSSQPCMYINTSMDSTSGPVSTVCDHKHHLSNTHVVQSAHCRFDYARPLAPLMSYRAKKNCAHGMSHDTYAQSSIQRSPFHSNQRFSSGCHSSRPRKS